MQHTQPVGLRHASGPLARPIADEATIVERRAAERQLQRRIDNYLVHRRRPQTTGMLAFIFDRPRSEILHTLVELERVGQVEYSRFGWEATQAP